jgi:hypothetical protein
VNRKKVAWRVGFLGVTLLAVVMELVAAWDNSGDTEPWTHLIGQYVPAPFTIAVILYGSWWLYDHFTHEYKKRGKPMDFIKLDARNRAFRTLLQGAVAAFVVGGLDAIRLALVSLGDGFDLGHVVSTAALAGLAAAVTSVLSYLHRTLVDPSPVPSNAPPVDHLRDAG